MKAKNCVKKKSIGHTMRRLRISFESIVSVSIAEQIAFHLAELKPEIILLNHLLDKIEKQNKITPKDIAKMMYFFENHWPYHLGKLKKLMKNRTLTTFAEEDAIQ